MNTVGIALAILAIAFAVIGLLIVKGSIKIPEANKDRYAKVSFGTSLILAAASIIAFFFPSIRAKLEERKRATAPTARVR